MNEEKKNLNRTCAFCCSGVIVPYKGYYACQSCQAVAFLSKNNDHKQKIADYLKKIKSILLQERESLTILEQNYLNGKIKNEELEFIKVIQEFRSLELELRLYLEKDFSFKDQRLRQNLYKLISVAEDLKKYFGEKYDV